MGAADLDAANSPDVPEGFFKDVKYFVVGDIPKWIESLLLGGGARREAYMTERLTHVLADTEDDEVTEARDLFSLAVVKSAWVVLSLRCGCQLPTSVFDPDPKNSFFSGLVACPSQLSAADNKLVWALVTCHGGRYQTRLDGSVTHLVTASMEGDKYAAAQQHKVRVVTPDWITLSAEARRRLDEPRYHPSLLVPDFSAPPSPSPPALSPPSSPVGVAKDNPARAVAARQQQATAALKIKDSFISDYENSELVALPTLPPVVAPLLPATPPVRIRIKKPVRPAQSPSSVKSPAALRHPSSKAPSAAQLTPLAQTLPSTQVPPTSMTPPTGAPSHTVASPYQSSPPTLVPSTSSISLASSSLLSSSIPTPSARAPPTLAPPPPPAGLMSQFHRIVSPSHTPPQRAPVACHTPTALPPKCAAGGGDTKSSTKGSSKGLNPRSSAAKINQLVSTLPPPFSASSGAMPPPPRLTSPMGTAARQGIALHHGVGAYGAPMPPAAGGGGRTPLGGVAPGGGETKVYYAHDPAEHVPEDVCLLGCVFYITDYQKTLEAIELDKWRLVITQRGGQIDDSYSNRITHVLCEHQRSDVFQLALRDGKRLVTAHWISDCLLAGRMAVPSAAIHFPHVYGKDRPCANLIVAATNFEGEDRERVKRMVVSVGARYTGYLSRAHSVLVARCPGGRKFQKAVECQMPIVNLAWLSSVVLGDLYALKIPVHARYQTFGDDPFRVDPACVAHLLEGWKVPVKISKEMWKKFQSSQLLRSPGGGVYVSPSRHNGAALGGAGNAAGATGASSGKRNNSGAQDGSLDSAATPCKRRRLTPADLNIPADTVPLVLLTGLPRARAQALADEVERLGGKLARSPCRCTHLVANTVCRTVNFVTALSIARHVVTSDWIAQSVRAGRFVDEGPFAIYDEKTEAAFGFSLRESLRRAGERKLFADLSFYFTPSVVPSRAVLVDMAESAGGRVWDALPPLAAMLRMVNARGEPTLIVVTCEEDAYLLRHVAARGIRCYHAEFVLTGLLTQTVDYQAFVFDM